MNFENHKVCNIVTRQGVIKLWCHPALEQGYIYCTIDIIPNNPEIPFLAITYHEYFDKLYVAPYPSDPDITAIRIDTDDKSNRSILELDILTLSDILELKRIIKEAIKWIEFWD